MMRSDPFAFASQAAEQIVRGLGIDSLPVLPLAIAEWRGISVVAKPMESDGVSGMLVRYGNEFAIAYATHLQNEGFQNFSIGHELGHYFLPGHADAVISGDTGSHVSRAGYSSTDRYEIEADRFAAGLLMPRHLFFPAIERAGIGLKAIEALAGLCKTSLHATAIRYAQCSREPVAVVVSKGGVIEHSFMSESLKSFPGIDWLKKREGVPRNTATFAFNQVPENVLRAMSIEDTAAFQSWFGGSRHIEIAEDVVGLGRYGKTLTVLHSIELTDEEDDEEQERLIDSWTPKFRK